MADCPMRVRSSLIVSMARASLDPYYTTHVRAIYFDTAVRSGVVYG